MWDYVQLGRLDPICREHHAFIPWCRHLSDQWRPVSCHLRCTAPGEGLSGFGRLYDRNWIVWVDFIFMFDNTWHTLPLGNFRTQQVSAVSAKLAYIFCGINLPRAISVQILVFLTNYIDILSWPWPNLSSNKKRCHLVVNVVNSAVQWHYLVNKVGAGDGRGSPRLVFCCCCCCCCLVCGTSWRILMEEKRNADSREMFSSR